MDETQVIEPVREPKRRWVGPLLIALAAVVAVALCAGGYLWWDHNQTAKAQQSCGQAYRTVARDAKTYKGLLDGDAKAASTIKATDVKDARTVARLSKDMKAKSPKTVSCLAKGRKAINRAHDSLDRSDTWYAVHTKTLKADIKAIADSKDQKTLEDGQKLYDSSNGQVSDENTRTTLRNALDRKDADKVRQAVDGVNRSIQAKKDADAKAAADAAQAQAAAGAAPQQAQAAPQQQSYSGYSGGSYSAPQSTYRAPAQQYSAPQSTYSAPAAPAPAPSAPAPAPSSGSGHYHLPPMGPPVCQAGQACGIG